jgi:RimJ/RimL family protein N-acetyltransferase
MSLTLETARLRLRPWDSSKDLDAFVAICSDHAVMRYIGDGHVWSEEESRRWINMNVEVMAMHGFCQWAVEVKAADKESGIAGGQLLGFCGFRSWENPQPGAQSALLGPLRPAMGW